MQLFLKVTDEGIIVTWAGSIMVLSMIQKRTSPAAPLDAAPA